MSGFQLDQHAPVGSGLTADVYAWDQGRVLKLFHAWASDARVDREFRTTRAMHAAGVRVPRAYELIEIEERRGIILECIGGPSLFEDVQARPWTLFSAARKLAELHAELHACVAPSDLPGQRQWLDRGIATASNLSAAKQHQAKCRLEELPDGQAICHGDFHPGNILLSPAGPIIIDWDTATRGHPLGDVACTSHLFRHASLPESTSLPIRFLFIVSRRFLHTAYLHRYFQLRPGSRQQIEAWVGPLMAAMSRWADPIAKQ